MALRDDICWIVDGLDSMLMGALPVWPRAWSTATGERLHEQVVRLHRRYFDSAMACTAHAAERAALEDQVSGLRDTNAWLTNRIEDLERQLAERTKHAPSRG